MYREFVVKANCFHGRDHANDSCRTTLVVHEGLPDGILPGKNSRRNPESITAMYAAQLLFPYLGVEEPARTSLNSQTSKIIGSDFGTKMDQYL